MSKTKETPAEESTAGASGYIDDATLYDLKRTLSKINTTIAMVMPRFDQINKSRFPLFGELMEIYYAAAKANVANGHDFIEKGLSLSEEQRKQAELVFGILFRGEEPPPSD